MKFLCGSQKLLNSLINIIGLKRTAFLVCQVCFFAHVSLEKGLFTLLAQVNQIQPNFFIKRKKNQNLNLDEASQLKNQIKGIGKILSRQRQRNLIKIFYLKSREIPRVKTVFGVRQAFERRISVPLFQYSMRKSKEIQSTFVTGQDSTYQTLELVFFSSEKHFRQEREISQFKNTIFVRIRFLTLTPRVHNRNAAILPRQVPKNTIKFPFPRWASLF